MKALAVLGRHSVYYDIDLMRTSQDAAELPGRDNPFRLARGCKGRASREASSPPTVSVSQERDAEAYSHQQP